MHFLATLRQKPMMYATLLVIATAFISGTNNFLTKTAVTAVKDPVVFTMLKNAVVALLIFGLLLVFRSWREIPKLSRRDAMRLIAIGIIGGSVPFLLYFIGLTSTTAINAGLIHKTLFLWVAFLAIPFLKERMSAWQWLGIGMIFVANPILGGFTGFKYNAGELMILAATLLWALENIIAKKALANVSSSLLAGARMILGSMILGAIVLIQGKTQLVTGLTMSQWAWTLLTSALLLGYVLTWYTALKYAPATYVATLLVPATLVTNMLSAIFITHNFPTPYILSTILFLCGSALIIRFAKKAHLATAPHTAPLTAA